MTESTARFEFIERELTRVDGHSPARQLPKHLKMAANPFVFLRGSAQLFYADLASGVIQLPQGLDQLPLTTIMGDCHLANFGFLSEEGSHGDSIIFCPNDFDDACMGHAAWDLLRFSVSLALAIDYAQGIQQGLYHTEAELSEKPVVGQSEVRAAIEAFLEAYIDICHEGLMDPQSRLFAISGFHEGHILSKRYQKALNRSCGGEHFKDKSSLAKAVDLNQFPLRFKILPDRFKAISALQYQEIEATFAPYVDDCIIDIVQRVNAGTGSINMARYYLLVGPNPETPAAQDLGLYHVVEVKKQRAAAPLHYFPNLSPVNQLNPAHLTVNCQLRMQRRPDLVLDEAEWQGAHWLIRSRHHARVGIDPEQVTFGKKAVRGGFIDYAATCGEALALAHCRGDRRSTLFEEAVCQALPEQIPSLITCALDYAEQVKQDCKVLRQMLSQS